METYILTMTPEARDFFCTRCKKTKKAKLTAKSHETGEIICNGCYGLLLSQKKTMGFKK